MDKNKELVLVKVAGTTMCKSLLEEVFALGRVVGFRAFSKPRFGLRSWLGSVINFFGAAYILHGVSNIKQSPGLEKEPGPRMSRRFKQFTLFILLGPVSSSCLSTKRS